MSRIWEPITNSKKHRGLLRKRSVYRKRGRNNRIAYLGGRYDMGIVGLWAGMSRGPLYELLDSFPAYHIPKKEEFYWEATLPIEKRIITN